MQPCWKYNKYSTIAISIIVLILVFQGLKLKHYSSNYIIRNDVVSYYAYLPAAFIYNDLSFKFVSDLPDDFPGDVWTHTSPNGKQTLKMTMGVAVLNLPFFIFTHIVALIFKLDPNGYSEPYQFSILLSAIFYLFFGLLFLRKILLSYFSDIIVAVTLLATVLATNLYYYTLVEPGMSHVYSFFLFSGFLYYTINWYFKPNWKNSILLGLFLGLIILVRPANALVVIIFLMYGKEPVRDQLGKLWQEKFGIITIVIVAFLIVFLQLIYWKFSTGEWIYYSYGKERFFFNNPEIINGLFSYRKGWLIYTPVMILTIIGFAFLRKKVPELFLPILIYFILNLYVIFSWWCWWYGGSFGARSLIETYALLSIPLASIINFISKKSNYVKGISLLILCFFIYLNLFQSRQYRTSQIHWDSMSKGLYWENFLDETWPENYKELLDPPDYESALQGRKTD